MGIDLGTQSVKVVVYDPESRSMIAEAASALDLIARPDGTREQLAEDWITALLESLAAIPAEVKTEVHAIGVSGQQHGFVPLDKQRKVLAPVKLWCDTATAQEAREITESLGGDLACRALAGNSVPAGFTASKVLWLKKNNPEAYAALDTILLPHDYINFYLTGKTHMEYGDASGTGFFDVRSRQWCADLLKAIDADRDLASCLPPLIEADQPAGRVHKTAAQKTGLPEGALVSAGGGDNMMAAIGTGNVHAGALTASLGTSGTLFAYSDTPIIDDGGDLAAFCSSTGGWLPLGCTMNCTVATEQVRELLNIPVAELEQLASSVPIGCDGVLTLPFYNGERMPNLPAGKAVIYGLDTSNCSQGHLLRSAMEAAAFGMKMALMAFERCGMKFTHVTLTGGGSKSSVWRQIFADTLNLPVRVLQQEENAAFGAALQALWCLGRENGSQDTIVEITKRHLTEDPSKSCVPNPENIAQYEALFTKYSKLVETITPLFETQ